ncbi:uncharacterized protein MONOS_17589 [Monocercomonoides exilis]|uniref:uncharacterized protein n=1 Tax=Monocercomonoides exilis TaxID=2049356 RepID=UPI00355AB1B3|nr:hypothetical protein MONOS_17589 [Monocercomonoides exilis]
MALPPQRHSKGAITDPDEDDDCSFSTDSFSSLLCLRNGEADRRAAPGEIEEEAGEKEGEEIKKIKILFCTDNKKRFERGHSHLVIASSAAKNTAFSYCSEKKKRIEVFIQKKWKQFEHLYLNGKGNNKKEGNKPPPEQLADFESNRSDESIS